MASQASEDPLIAEFPEAQFIWRVQVNQVFPNCPRYIHEYRLVRRSAFVPKRDRKTPVPAWKTRPWAKDVLAEKDPAHDPDATIV